MAELGFRFVVLSIPAESFDVEVVITNREVDFFSDYEAAASAESVAVINGSMVGFGEAGEWLPIGLIVANGRTIGKFVGHGKGGVISWTSKGTSVVRSVDYVPQVYGVTDHALQLYPMLVEEGKMGIHTIAPEPRQRTAIGLGRDGELLLAGLFAPVWPDGLNLYDFAALLIAERRCGGAGAHSILNLDGGPGSHLYVPSLQRHWGSEKTALAGNFIHVTRRLMRERD